MVFKKNNRYHYYDALRNMKTKVHTPDRDTEFFNIVAEVLQMGILVSSIFIFCFDYVLRMLIDLIKFNGFSLKSKGTDDIPKKL